MENETKRTKHMFETISISSATVWWKTKYLFRTRTKFWPQFSHMPNPLSLIIFDCLVKYNQSHKHTITHQTQFVIQIEYIPVLLFFKRMEEEI